MQLYGKAQAIARKSRVVFNKAEFEIGSAKFWEPILSQCVLKLKTIGLCYFKPETPSPNGV
jgi:hypothetical protein